MRRDRLLPGAPAYATCGVAAFFYHLAISILHLLGLGRPCPHKLGVRRDNNIVVAQSCRAIFYEIWGKMIPENARVLTNPFHHTSYVRIMGSSNRNLVICGQRNNVLLEPENEDPKDFTAVVITHMLGRDFEAPWLKRWKEENPNLLLIEDRVQGGLLSDDKDSIYDVSLYSTGQDKLPNFMGGGFASVHSKTHPRLYDELADAIEALPFESAWARVMFLVKKIPTVLIYNVPMVTRAVEWAMYTFFGFSRCDLTDTYRKKNPGFMHHGFAIRPSPALLQSMEPLLDFAPWVEKQRDCTRRFRLFLSKLDPAVRPFVQPFGADTSCCYFFVSLPDFKRSRAMLGERGVITINNQTYVALAPEHAPALHGLTTLASMLAMNDEQIAQMAQFVSETWRTVGADVLAKHSTAPEVVVPPAKVC